MEITAQECTWPPVCHYIPSALLPSRGPSAAGDAGLGASGCGEGKKHCFATLAHSWAERGGRAFIWMRGQYWGHPSDSSGLGRRALQGKPGGFSGTERERGEPVGTRRATGRHYSGRPWGGGNPGRMRETIPGRSGLSEEGLFVCRGRGRYLRGTRRALLRGWGSDIRPDPARGHPGPLEGAGAAAAALPGGAVAGRCPNCTAMQRSLSRGNLWQCSISGQGKP